MGHGLAAELIDFSRLQRQCIMTPFFVDEMNAFAAGKYDMAGILGGSRDGLQPNPFP